MDDDVADSVTKKYKIENLIGKGFFSGVWKAKRRSNNRTVALKRISDAFKDERDFRKMVLEVTILQELNHPNVVTLFSFMRAGDDVYLEFEYMEADLYVVIRANILKDIHKQYILYQVLKGLKYLHSGGIIHRDLKPSNLLVDSDCCVKIADFTFARSIAPLDCILTDYVATRWYRPPEILFGSVQPSFAIDIWAVGCIFGELLSGKPLFAGCSVMNQIVQILEATGRPNEEDVETFNSPFTKTILNSLTLKKKKPWIDLVPDASEEEWRLLNKFLQLNPDKRISCEEALEHPYFSDFHDVEEEFCVDKSFSIPNVEDRKFSMVELYNAAKVRGRTRIKERRTVHKVKKIHVISGEVGEELI